MCGFTGVYNEDILNIKYSKEELCHLLHHRGPDYSAMMIKDKFLFAHNRLAIIDLSSKANQPYISEDTGTILLFNGEVFNYKELKRKYKDIHWKTSSDTEVIIKLYDSLGPRFVSELNGIFAFAIFDKRNHKLLFYRDRVGVKPFYYKITSDNIYFSSEIKGILYFLNKYDMNYCALYDYVEHGLLCHNENTFIDGIYSLAPGTYLEVQLDDFKYLIHTYWDISFTDLSYKSESEIYEETLFLLQESVRLNLVGDVEIGLSLSSGLDSTLLFYLLNEQGADRLRSFTFGFKDKKYDEVSRVYDNNLLDLHDHHPVYLDSNNMVEILKEAIYFFEAPLGGLGTLSAYNMMKSVRDTGIKVMLAGEGADDVFAGYQYYYAALFKDLEYDVDLLNKELECYNRFHNKNVCYNSEEYREFVNTLSGESVIAPDGTMLNSDTYCSDDLLELVRHKSRDDKKKGSMYLSTLKSVMYKDLKEKKLPKLLFFQDRASMANSVETRVPYLDHRLIEIMYTLPSQYKMRNGQTKYLARKILQKHFGVTLNTDVKHYVATPQREWLKSNLNDEVTDILKNGYLMKNGFIKMETFLADYKQYKQSRELGNSFFVWKMLNLEFLLSSYF